MLTATGTVVRSAQTDSSSGGGAARARIGWIGAGRMGVAMASFILRAGYPLAIWSRTAAHCAPLVDLGARQCVGIAHCVADADIVFTCVSDDAALRRVVEDADGVLAHARRGTALVDTSTVSAEASAAVAQAATSHGVDYLRIPVSGNAASARRGEVTLLVSGSREVWERVRPVTETFSVRQLYLGDGEEARAMKLVINALVVNLAQAMTEALTLGRAAGLPWPLLLETVAQSTIASPFVKAKTAQLAARDFGATMTASLILKDIDLMLAAAARGGVEMPLTATTRDRIQAVVDAGMGEEDYLAAIKLAERAAGLGEP